MSWRNSRLIQIWSESVSKVALMPVGVREFAQTFFVTLSLNFSGILAYGYGKISPFHACPSVPISEISRQSRSGISAFSPPRARAVAAAAANTISFVRFFIVIAPGFRIATDNFKSPRASMPDCGGVR